MLQARHSSSWRKLQLGTVERDLLRTSLMLLWYMCRAWMRGRAESSSMCCSSRSMMSSRATMQRRAMPMSVNSKQMSRGAFHAAAVCADFRASMLPFWMAKAKCAALVPTAGLALRMVLPVGTAFTAPPKSGSASPLFAQASNLPEGAGKVWAVS